MIRVLEISISSFARLGTTMHLLNYYKYIEVRQVQADFVAFRNVDSVLVNEFVNMGYKVVRLKSRDARPIQYFIELVRLIKKEEYDIVRVHGSSGLLALEMLAALVAGCKTRIVHSHNTHTTHPFISKLLCPLLYFSSNVRFSCGREAGIFLFGKRNFAIIPNGIDVRNYQFCGDIRKQVRKEWGLQEAYIIGHVGNINAQKNHRFLIDVLMELKKYSPKYVLVCVGDGNTAELISQCERQGIADSVYFLGKREDVPRLLQGFDLVILPSLYEGFPLVAVEWQAAGLPCYISDVVTKEVAFSEEVYFLPLESGAKGWAEKIWRERKAYVLDERGRGIDTVKEAGYDIRDNTKSLDKLFHSLVGKSN